MHYSFFFQCCPILYFYVSLSLNLQIPLLILFLVTKYIYTIVPLGSTTGSGTLVQYVAAHLVAQIGCCTCIEPILK